MCHRRGVFQTLFNGQMAYLLNLSAKISVEMICRHCHKIWTFGIPTGEVASMSIENNLVALNVTTPIVTLKENSGAIVFLTTAMNVVDFTMLLIGFHWRSHLLTCFPTVVPGTLHVSNMLRSVGKRESGQIARIWSDADYLLTTSRSSGKNTIQTAYRTSV
jgi:hypothetical protein